MITLFTDASFDNRFPEAAAFAVWAKGGPNSPTLRLARNFKAPNHPRSSYEAEAMAIIVGMVVARKKFPDEDHLHICSDCIPAMQKIVTSRSLVQIKTKRNRKGKRIGTIRVPLPDHLAPVESHLQAFLKDNPNLKITFKHVKAHTVKRDTNGEAQQAAPRSHVNDWCDLEARKLMVGRRHEIQQAMKAAEVSDVHDREWRHSVDGRGMA